MNEQYRDPPRWLESGVLPEELAKELSAYGAQAPLEASKERMLSQLASQLGELPLAAKPVALAKFKLLIGSAVLLAGAVGLLQFQGPLPKRQPERDGVQVQAPRVAPISLTALPPEQPVLEAVEALPVAPRPARNIAPVRALPEPELVEAPRVQPANPDVMSELTMLARARRALLNEPARALELAEEHAQTYPRGTFDEEREVLAIEALLKLGRRAEADARERAFEARFPRSAQIAHLARMIAKPSE
jgi:hypothetical protein